MNFKLIDEHGKNIECEILYTLEDKKNKYNYIIYTTGELDKNGKKIVYAARYEIKNNHKIKQLEKEINNLKKSYDKNEEKTTNNN